MPFVSNTTGEVYLSGGPYIGTRGEFPYSYAYERSTIVVETCVPRDDCKIFSLYDKIDPLVDVFVTPDGSKYPPDIGFEFLFQQKEDDMWKNILGELGGRFSMYSKYPVDPRLN